MLAMAALVAAAGTAPPSIAGGWVNPARSVTVAIAPCGDEYCGTVEWASDKAAADARRGGTDPLVGTRLFTRLAPKGDRRWAGRVFVPDINKTSRATLSLVAPDRLKVTGCAVGGLLCKSQLWTRAEPR